MCTYDNVCVYVYYVYVYCSNNKGPKKKRGEIVKEHDLVRVTEYGQ